MLLEKSYRSLSIERSHFMSGWSLFHFLRKQNSFLKTTTSQCSETVCKAGKVLQALCQQKDPHWFSRVSFRAADVKNFLFVWFFCSCTLARGRIMTLCLLLLSSLKTETDELLAWGPLLQGSWCRGARDERTKWDLKLPFKCHYSERNVVNTRADKD